MYSSEPISREMDKLSSFLFSGIGSSSFKNGEGIEPEFFKSKEITGSNYFHQQSQFQHQSSDGGGGLARYRSAPSSFFAGILDGDGNNSGENFITHDGSSSSDSESMFTTLLNNNNENNTNSNISSNSQKNQVQLGSYMKQEIGEEIEFGNGKGLHNRYESSGGISYYVGVQMQSRGSLSNNGNSGSNLIRQSSSPAGFFNGFMKEVGNFGGTNREASTSTNGFSNHISYSSTAQSSSSNFMPSIAENESWNDTSFNSLKRNRDGDLKLFSNNFSGMSNQNDESRNYTSDLTHHLSLPKTSTEVAAIEKYLQFQQDSVPCKIRAKRGCATHPRSIAERMRRTRISERMKKLQDLFPNMDKQTNTADMLDLAVDYIKDLQKQVQTLTDKKAKCSCPSKQLQYSNGTT